MNSKLKIKSWYPDHCPCRLCKTYIAQLGFIWSAYIHLFMAEPCYIHILVAVVYLQYVALVSFGVVTIIFICTYSIYISICIFTYVFDLTYCHYDYYIFNVDFNRHIDWYKLELILCILSIWLSFSSILSTRNNPIHSNTIQSKTSMSNPVESLEYIKCYSWSGPKPIQSPSNSIRHNCQKISSSSKRPKAILEIRKKATFL